MKIRTKTACSEQRINKIIKFFILLKTLLRQIDDLTLSTDLKSVK